VDAFLNLHEDYQVAIADVTKRMGAGMAEFIEKEARNARNARSAHARVAARCGRAC
jgi:hypothetical protein